jgi:hypothetical protein
MAIFSHGKSMLVSFNMFIFHCNKFLNFKNIHLSFVVNHALGTIDLMAKNTELAIHALDQVHCWGAYFRPKIGHYEKFTLLNFQPHLFSKQR